MSVPDPTSVDWVPLGGIAIPGISRVVFGQVSGAGAILSGSGFTVVHAGGGQFTINITIPFAAPPIAIGTVMVTGLVGVAWVEGALTAAQVKFGIANGAAGYADLPFNFILLGN